MANFVIWFSVSPGLGTLKARFRIKVRISGRARLTITDRTKLELGLKLT